MSLRLEWVGETETPQLLELAMEDRYVTASALLARGEWDGAIYLLGYVGEIVLKTAYFRLRGESLASPISAMLFAARSRGKILIPLIRDENLHSLFFWAELLRAERAQQNNPLPSVTDMFLGSYSSVLYWNWLVEMRYHPNRATPSDAFDVAEAAFWLLDNRLELGT